jgi:hypothetical protein
MRLLLTLLVIGGLARPAWADSAGGASAFDFLNLDPDVRGVGMGGAYTALATNSSALFYNPAGLGRAVSNEASFMQNSYVQGVNQEYMGFADKRGWGVNLNYLDFGSIDRTTLLQPGGTGSTFGLNDLALGGGYGRAITPDLSVGAGGKYLRETIDNIQANGFALDLGALYSVPGLKGLNFGLSALNLGPSVKFLAVKEQLPMTVRLGSAYSFQALGGDNTVALDLSKQIDDKVRMGAGFESVYKKFMAFRFGFTTRNDAGIGITGGVGWMWKSLGIDYAIAPLGDLGLSNRLSLTVRWGGPVKAAEPVTQNAAPADPPANSPEDHFLRAQAFIETKSFAEAKKELAEALSLLAADDRLRVLYYERMGTIARFQGDMAEAKYSYAEAMKEASTLGLSDPVVADTYTGFGLCLVAEGDTNLAVKFFKKALEVGASPRTTNLLKEQLQRLHAAVPAPAPNK